MTVKKQPTKTPNKKVPVERAKKSGKAEQPKKRGGDVKKVKKVK